MGPRLTGGDAAPGSLRGFRGDADHEATRPETTLSDGPDQEEMSMADEDKDEKKQEDDEAKTGGASDESKAADIGAGGKVGDKSAEDFGPGGDAEEAPMSGGLPGPVNPPGAKPDDD